MNKSEYTKSMVSGSSCSYNTLGHYYGGNSTMAPLPARVTKNVYVTPDYSAIGYNALTHGQKGGCGSHFNIQNAYPGNGNCSTSYTTRLCNSGKQ
jgi:hypothetical protein